jgi:hypothetical protein
VTERRRCYSDDTAASATPVAVMCYSHCMAKKGPRATHPNRMNVTIRCDRDVYMQAREILQEIPDTSLSDVVERFLHEFVGTFRPFIAELKSAESEPAALAILQRFVAGTIGQASLQFARQMELHEREREERLDAAYDGQRPYRDLDAEDAAAREIKALEDELAALSRERAAKQAREEVDG